MGRVTSVTKKALANRGVALQRRAEIGFGADWTDDLFHYLGPGRHRFIDIGANEGQTAAAMLRRFPEAEIHSFEPVPATYEILEEAVAGTGVRTVNCAVGAAPGTETMYVGEASGLNSLHGSGEAIEVKVTTLDEYAEDAFQGRIDLLKIDTEGHENPVLRGAEALIEAGRISHVLAECEFDRGPHEPHGDFREISDLLSDHGYRIVAFYCGGVDDLGWRWGDVLFRRVTPEMIANHRAEEFAQSPFARL